MTPMHVVINAVAQVTIWLAVIWLATWLVRNDKQAVQWRMLLLRIGLAGLPVVLLLGSLEAAHVLPWVRPLWRVDTVAAPTAAGQPGQGAASQRAMLAGERPADGKGQPAGAMNSAQGQPTQANPAMMATGAAPSKSSHPPMEAGVSTGSTAAPPAGAWNALWSIWSGRLWICLPWAFGLAWLGGVAVMLLRLAVGLVRLRVRQRNWRSAQNETIRALAARVAGQVGLRRPFRLLACDDLPMPVATGIWRPAVVLPRGQFSYLVTPEGRAILAHELAHLRFCDPLWRLAGAVLGALLWFHPLMIWLMRRVEIESEFQCDQAALEAGADRRHYARLLVGLAELAWTDRPLAAAAIGAVHRASHLERRLTMILAKGGRLGRLMEMGRGTRWAMVGLSALLVVSLSSVALLGSQRNLLPPQGEGRGEGVAENSRPAAQVLARPDAGAPKSPNAAPADRAVILLVDGQRLEGIWLGSTSENVHIQAGDLEKTIPLHEVAEIRMIRPGSAALTAPPAPAAPAASAVPPGPPGLAGSRHPGQPLEFLKLPAEQAEEALRLRQHVTAAEARLAEARKLDGQQANRNELIAQAEKDLQSAHEAVDQFRRKIGRPAGDPQVIVRDMARRADELSAAGRWQDAIGVLVDLRKLAPRNPAVLRALIKAHERASELDQADEVRKALRDLPVAGEVRPAGPRGSEDRKRDPRKPRSADGDDLAADAHR